MKQLKAIDIVGLSEKRAVSKIEKWGYRSRITKRDGIPYIVTRDWVPCRFNLEIEENTVVGADLG